jgi:hypothetical protein
MADGLVSSGSRGGGTTEDIVPPPYMPSLDSDLEAGGRGAEERRGGSRTSLERWGKDQEFPGLR